MSLMGGLVDTSIEEHIEAAPRSRLGDWTVRHAWQLVIAVSTLFWAAVAGAVYLG